MLQKILCISTVMLLSFFDLFGAETQRQQVQPNAVQFRRQQFQPHALELRYFGIAALALGVGVVFSTYESHCCNFLGGGQHSLQGPIDQTVNLDGVRYEQWYDTTSVCSYLRENFCPDVKVQNRVLARKISCESNCGDVEGHCFYSIDQKDIKKLEEKGIQVDAQGYVTYPNDEKK